MASQARRQWVWLGAALLGAALGFTGAAEYFATTREGTNLLLFGAWVAALAFLFILGLRVPVQMRFGRYASFAVNSFFVLLAIALTLLANMALYYRDVHFDLTREGTYTAPEQAQTVIRGLRRDVSFIYFYHDDDPQALHAKDLLQTLARSNEHFHVRVIDPDTEPALAHRYGVTFYNTAVVEVDGRRVTAENTTDLKQMTFAVIRALKQEIKTICFIVGHGEPFEPGGIQFHYTHTETLHAHDVQGGGDILEGRNSGFDRFYLALTNLGYKPEQIELAKVPTIGSRCSVVVDGGPRSPYAPQESRVLSDYMAAGGRALLMYDPDSPLEPSFAAALERIGIRLPAATIIDPTDHYATDPEKVAIPYYPPHPITEQLALTFFPGARPITIVGAPDGVKLESLFASTRDSYLRAETGALPAQSEAGAQTARLGVVETAAGQAQNEPRLGQRTIAVSASGRWPGTPVGTQPFRLVVVGDSDFATNAYFALASNSTLAVSMIRWLAGDESAPAVKPETYAEPQIVMTNYQMKVTFAVVEIFLPLSVILVGALVWWRRR
jgi:ABC-2 type transport system permease protein